MEATASAGRAILLALCLSLVVTLSAGVPAEADATRPTISTSTFRLDPKKDRVEVNVRVTVTNRIPSRITVGPCPDAPARTCRTRTSFYVASFGYFSIQLGARGVRFSGPGVKGRIDRQNAFYTDYVVEFTPIYSGQSRTFKARYYLPAAGPRSPNRTRLMQAYAHFCWHGQPTDRGSATAILPPDSVPTTEYGAVITRRTRQGVVLRSRRAGSIGHFYACTDSFKPARLVRTETATSDGQTITVEGWPEDPEWSAVITSGVEETLPVLEEIAGAPIPGGDVVVRQVAAQALGKYAGDFNDKIGQIRVSETYDDPMLVAHELAHAWFNRTSIKDTWIMEGHAEWMAHQANHRACGDPSAYPGKGKPDLARWQYLAVDSSKRDVAVVDYQYSCLHHRPADRVARRTRSDALHQQGALGTHAEVRWLGPRQTAQARLARVARCGRRAGARASWSRRHGRRRRAAADVRCREAKGVAGPSRGPDPLPRDAGPDMGPVHALGRARPDG